MQQNEIEMCFHMLGDNNSHNLVVQFSEGVESVRYKALGRDELGVFLLSDDDLKSRLPDEAAIQCYDETQGASALYVTIVDDDGFREEHYPVERLDYELTDQIAFGA